MNTLTTTIKREWLDKIVAGTKKIEYRELKPYWKKRLAPYLGNHESTRTCRFQLRLINGMQPKAPEVTVLVDAIKLNRKERQYELHIGAVLEYKNCNKRLRAPA